MTDAVLEQALVALPHLRSMSVLIDGDGQVLASSIRPEAGQLRIALDAPGRCSGAPARSGWADSFRDAALPRCPKPPAGEPARAGVGFIPLVRAQERQPLLGCGPDQPGLRWPVTSCAPWTTRPQSTYLLSYQGELLAASGPMRHRPGAPRLATHPVFRDYLPAIEHASYVGQGSLAERPAGGVPSVAHPPAGGGGGAGAPGHRRAVAAGHAMVRAGGGAGHRVSGRHDGVGQAQPAGARERAGRPGCRPAGCGATRAGTAGARAQSAGTGLSHRRPGRLDLCERSLGSDARRQARANAEPATGPTRRA